MWFLNPWLVPGLLVVAIPVILHLVRRQAAKPIAWGAMRFLFDTVALRRRRIEWEDMLLMAARCLLLALAALALARPFIPPDSPVPWTVVLPLALLGIAAFGASFVLASRRSRMNLRAVAAGLLVLAAAAILLERWLNLRRFQAGDGRDLALVVDASTSMTLVRGNRTAFDLAVEEARQIVKQAPRGTAFTVILGGPAPERLSGTPLSHRADVLDLLGKVRPVGGPFRAHDALGVALLALAEGSQAGKEIVVLTDGQRVGWKTDDPAAWQSLGEAARALPRKPKLVVRALPPPEHLRNLTLHPVALSRDVVGTDREVGLRVTVANTGTEAVTPPPVEMRVGNLTLPPGNVGQLAPGGEATVEFRHRFATAGPQVVVARVSAGDDLPGDDQVERVVAVRKRLPVLLVDGNPAGPFFDRAASFTALALAPAATVAVGGGAGDAYLMEPKLMAAADLTGNTAFEPYPVVVLADVPRLPAPIADRLAAHVTGGGGLLVLAGPRCEPGFFNDWTGGDGRLLPAPLGPLATDITGVTPALATFDHPALALLADPKTSDLGSGQVAAWRRVEEDPEAARRVAARFTNGAPFLLARAYGQGRVAVATGGFDNRSGSLPARRSFVPLVHEWVTWLAGAGGATLNVEASWRPTAWLPGGGGLIGDYFRDDRQRRPVLTRADPVVDFAWGDGSPDRRLPADRFAIRWRGRLAAPRSGEYKLESEVDDEIEVRIGGQLVLKNNYSSRNHGIVPLEAGVPVPIEIHYREESSNAGVRLLWTPPGGTRAPVPASCLFPPGGEGGDGLVLGEAEGTDPLGAPRHVRLLAGTNGRLLEFSGSAVPGLYQFKPPEDTAALFGVEGEARVPLVVTRDPAESRFTPWTQDDRNLMRAHLDLVEARGPDDILAVLRGLGFGKELWRLLAAAALALLLAEVALARWISRSRRAGEDLPVDFAARGQPDAAFLKELEKLKS